MKLFPSVNSCKNSSGRGTKLLSDNHLLVYSKEYLRRILCHWSITIHDITLSSRSIQEIMLLGPLVISHPSVGYLGSRVVIRSGSYFTAAGMVCTSVPSARWIQSFCRRKNRWFHLHSRSWKSGVYASPRRHFRYTKDLHTVLRTARWSHSFVTLSETGERNNRASWEPGARRQRRDDSFAQWIKWD